MKENKTMKLLGKLGVVFFLSILLCSIKLFSQDFDVNAILTKCSSNQNKLDYTGVVKREIVNRDRMFAIEQKIIFLAPDKMWIETSSPEKISQFTIVRNGKKLYYRKSNKEQFRFRRFTPRMGTDSDFYVNEDWLGLLKKNYDFRTDSVEKIAGRLCVPVRLLPKYEGRPSIKAWFDEENGFILKLEKYNAQGDMRYRYYYMTIDFHPAIDENIFDIDHEERKHRREREYETYVSTESLDEKAQKELVKVNYIPEGFILDRIVVSERRAGRFYHLIYADGLNVISLFQEKIDLDRKDNRHSKRDRIKDKKVEHRGSKIIIREIKGEYFISVIGSLSIEEMEKMFASIEN